MKYEYLSKTVAIKTVSEDATVGHFEVEGLYTGYGITIGNALRRTLLSSLPGGAITQVKIAGVNHEFSTIEGVKEDVVEIILNLKRIRFRAHETDSRLFEPQTLTLNAKGPGVVTAADISPSAVVDIITPDAPLATLADKNAKIEMELIVEKGLGYVPAEARVSEKLPIGVIAVDAIFSPVTDVSFTVENMRVGDRTDYNKLLLTIKTDGSITPSQALRKASRILDDHFVKMSEVSVTEPKPVEPPKKKVAKKTKK